MNRRSYTDRLNGLIEGVEDLLIASPDRDVTCRDAGIEQTRAFIKSRLAEREVSDLPPVVRRRSQRTLAARRAIPRDAVGRRRLLGRLVATHASVPAHISMAFESREPDDSEVEELLRELLQDGDVTVTE